MPPRPATLFLLGVAAGAAGFVLLAAHARWRLEEARPGRAEGAAMVERLGLTDLCLFTDARYGRHPSQADRHAPFQDHPMALEHFPSGTIIRPPGHLRPR